MKNWPMTQVVTKRGQQIGIIVSASLAGFMVLLDSNIVNISLPVMAAYFNISTGKVVQVTLIYLLMLSSSLIIFGKLSEKYGAKTVFITGFIVFTLSSFLCGIAHNFIMLLIYRSIQALGGSMLYATSISLITKFIPLDRRGWAFGIFSPLSSLGMLIGNPLGGLITGMLNWHWIFLVNIPIGIAAIFAAWKAIPNDFPVRSRKRSKPIWFDVPGSLLSFAGMGLLVFFISRGRNLGWGSMETITGLSTAFILILLFVLWERHARDPILDLAIFKDRNFSFAIIASVAGFGLMAGSGVLLPFYLTLGLNIDVAHAGFILMTFPVIFSMASPLTGRLSDRMSKIRLTILGMTIAAIGCFGFAWLLPKAHLGILFGYMILLGIAYGLFITPNNNLVMTLAREDKQSISSSFFKLATNLGQMLGLIVMEMIFALFTPQAPDGKGFDLKSVPRDELMPGFSWAFVAGGLICLVAVLFSIPIRESNKETVSHHETAIPG